MKEGGACAPLRIAIVAPGERTEGGITEVVRLVLPHLEQHPDVSVQWIETHASGSWLRKLLVAARALIQAGWCLPRADVVHIHSSYWMSCLRKSVFLAVAKLFGKPVIWHLHVPDLDFGKLFHGNGLMNRYARWVVSRTNVIVVLSARWAPMVRGTFPEKKLQVIYNPAVDHVCDPCGRQQDKLILYIGHLIRRKGYDVLLKAFAEIASSVPDWKLVFAGSGEMDRAARLASDLGVSRQVRFAGWVSGEERRDLMRRASIVVLPSHQEGLPMSVLEAMAAGRALVTTPVGGIPDVVTHGVSGLLVPPGLHQPLADALLQLISNKPLRTTLGLQAREAVRMMSAESVAAQWVGLYRSLTGTSNGGARGASFSPRP